MTYSKRLSNAFLLSLSLFFASNMQAADIGSDSKGESSSTLQKELREACYADDREKVESLLKKGVDPEPIFIFNARAGWIDCMDLLAKYVKDPSTGLFPALEAGDYGLAKELIRYGANPDFKNERGETPLEWLFSLRNRPNLRFDMIKFLVKNGAKVDRTDSMWNYLKEKEKEYVFGE